MSRSRGPGQEHRSLAAIAPFHHPRWARPIASFDVNRFPTPCGVDCSHPPQLAALGAMSASACDRLRGRRLAMPGLSWERRMPTAYAARDERYTWNDIKVLRVTGLSHGAASASVGASSFPRRATRMGVRRPALGCERGTMRRTRDAIASLDRPARCCDRAAGKGGVVERNRRKPR